MFRFGFLLSVDSPTVSSIFFFVSFFFFFFLNRRVVPRNVSFSFTTLLYSFVHHFSLFNHFLVSTLVHFNIFFFLIKTIFNQMTFLFTTLVSKEEEKRKKKNTTILFSLYSSMKEIIEKEIPRKRPVVLFLTSWFWVNSSISNRVRQEKEGGKKKEWANRGTEGQT